MTSWFLQILLYGNLVLGAWSGSPCKKCCNERDLETIPKKHISNLPCPQSNRDWVPKSSANKHKWDSEASVSSLLNHSRGAKSFVRVQKVKAKGLPNHSFGHNKWPHPLQKSQTTTNRNRIQKPANHHAFQYIKNSQNEKRTATKTTSQQTIKSINNPTRHQPGSLQLSKGPAALSKPGDNTQVTSTSLTNGCMITAAGA